MSTPDDGEIIVHPAQLEASEKLLDKKMATVVQDNPLDIFPSDEEDNQTHNVEV